MKTTLEKWAQAQYGDAAPTAQTLRRWVRESRIFPAPRKHGRSYFVDENARYVGSANDPSFMARIHESA